LSAAWYAAKTTDERINTPGTQSEQNWSYRLPATIDRIAADNELVNRIREVCVARNAKKA
jgi:4-alpha-glucanotransferase